MQTIKPQDFSSRTTDPNRETWTLGTVEHVAAALEGHDVIVETDKRTGHSVQGRIVGYASSGDRNPGARLHVETTYVENGVEKTQRTNYLLWEIGVIVDLDRSFAKGAKWVALDTRREAEREARERFYVETGIAPYSGSLEVTGLGFGRYSVRHVATGARQYEATTREIRLEPATV